MQKNNLVSCLYMEEKSLHNRCNFAMAIMVLVMFIAV